jgi:PAS domain S-box-containing protein
MWLVAGEILEPIRVAIIAALALAAAAIAAVLGHRPAPPPRDMRELDRFQILSDRLEKGIEKLKDLQWELTDNETRYRDLLDSQNDIITRVDARGRLTFVNRAFCRTFAVEAGEVLGTPFKPEVLQHEVEAREAAESGRRQRFEQLVMTADGARWFAFEQTAILGDDGNVREIQLLGRDISEQRRIQNALAEARDQAESANRAKSRFLAAMSHEIRTPMNGILGMANLLSETELSAEQRSYISAIDYSAKNLLTIIDEILDLSKIEAGKLEMHPAPFPLDECVQSVVELMWPRAREKQLDLAWRLDPDLPRTVIGDETRVRQILLNLLGNAVKFTDAGGVVVRVRRSQLTAASKQASDKPGQICIEVEVADSGAGIAENLMQNLFAEFEQADDAVRRKRSGTGLGLAISRRLARAMDGDIEVESTLEVGSTFRARMVLLAQPGARQVLPTLEGRRMGPVLVVSGRLRQRTIIQETLLSLGIDCEVATRETVAGTVATAHQAGLVFDTVIADAEEGPQAVGQLISEACAPGQRQPRAVLVVDQAGGSRLETFKSVGCDAYLVRPVRPASLVTQLGLDRCRGEARMMAVEADARTAPGPGPASMTRGRRILLVEDNDINALLARRMSEKAGCIVHHAPSGPDALGWCEDILAKSDTVDLVLMDIHMPEMDGFETARRIRRLFAARDRVAPPIVALTANAFAEDRKRCLEAGLDDYLAKPFDRSELEALLRKWCATEQSPRDGSIDGCAA